MSNAGLVELSLMSAQNSLRNAQDREEDLRKYIDGISATLPGEERLSFKVQALREERDALRRDLQALREQLKMTEAERDVWSGEACRQEQAEGNGPCGGCRHCLPEMLREAKAQIEKKS